MASHEGFARLTKYNILHITEKHTSAFHEITYIYQQNSTKYLY